MKELVINREPFYEQIRRQSRQWELFDKKIIEEEKEVKPYRPKNKVDKNKK